MSVPVPAPDDQTTIDPVNEPEPAWRPGDGNTDQPNPARGEESDDGDEEEDDDEEDDADSDGGSSVGNG